MKRFLGLWLKRQRRESECKLVCNEIIDRQREHYLILSHNGRCEVSLEMKCNSLPSVSRSMEIAGL